MVMGTDAPVGCQDTGAPLRPLRTAVAGGLVALAHVQSWLLVRLGWIDWFGTGPSDAYEAASLATVLALYGLGPAAIAILLAPPAQPQSERALAEAVAQTASTA